jgi:multidrug efflux pump subunit AcrA (membrane-fusion protein)
MAPPLGEDLIAEPRRIRRADLAVSEGFTAPPGDLVMVVRDTRVALGLDGSVTTPEAVVLLGELLSPEDTVIGVEIATLRPVQVVRAPVTAVMSGGEGSLCVWLDATDGFEERKVVVVSSTVSGVALVTDGLVSGDRVLVNPASILLDPTCT